MSPSTPLINREHVQDHFGDQVGWLDTIKNAWVITRREVRDSFRDWRIVVPIFILTLFFPTLANFSSRIFINYFDKQGADGKEFIEAFLPLMPMLVGFFPVSISLVIALETFVGEKERRSLEPLLSTPLTNTELYLGKVFAAMIPPVAAAYLGIGLYIGQLIWGEQKWRPDPVLILMIVALTTVQALVMVTGAVVVSSQTTSTRAANLLASVIILPMSLLVIGESIIMIQPYRRFVLWYVAAGLLVVTTLLVRTGASIFNREELLGRSIDEINLRWAWRVFWEQLTGVTRAERQSAKATGRPIRLNPIRYYRKTVFPTIRNLRVASLAMSIAIIAAFAAGWALSTKWQLPLSNKDNSEVLDNLRSIWETAQKDPRWVGLAISQNIRVLLVATLLGAFSFGAGSIFFVALPFGILGYLMGNVAAAGISPIPFIVAIIPHGIFEIPAIIIAGAAGLRFGSVPTKPPKNMTVGEAWLRALADVVKIGLTVVLPLLIIAGIFEVYVTPKVVEWALTL
ncbi:MAG: stage II sporulation protein M [Chloroflexi bacterium]|nr:stage II sporulation protein M [Chloroflexota bacterium]